MTIFKFILWFLLTAAVYGALFAVWIPLRKKNKRWISIVGIVLEIVLAVACAYLDIALDTLLPRLPECILAMLYTALLADAATELLFLIIRLFKKNGLKMSVRFIAGIAVTIAYLAYMVINAQVVTPNYLSYTSDKLERDHKIVYLADLHYGNTQTKEAVKKALNEIKSEEPKLLLLGGDITDEFTAKEDMEYIYEQIGSLGIPTYFTYGNHDRQNHIDDVGGGRTYSDSELENAVLSNGIHILCDEYVDLGDLVILGREDYDRDKRFAVEELKERPDGKYVVNLDHSPYLNEDIVATDADLQLSGHVHAGQLFPLRWMYPLAVDHICGDYLVGDTELYVTSGFSDWCFPLRSESHCHYEVIELKKG